MSQQLINHNADLKQLRDEGYDIAVQENHLVVRQVPYVNSKKEIQRGILVSQLDVQGEDTRPPESHVIFFGGEYPCHSDGTQMTKLVNQENPNQPMKDVSVSYSFSRKPTGSGMYTDFYEKISTYVVLLLSQAKEIDPSVTAKVFPVIESDKDESVFNYIDTASSRAGIAVVTNKLELKKISIIGLGGTGSYVLDLVVKTPVKEIHIFDGDQFSNHNAFRSPGAPSVDELKNARGKASYFKEIYSKMHRHIIAHDEYLDASNIDSISDMDFVFLCLDNGNAKQLIIDKLLECGIPFIDVGMGVNLVDEALTGLLRVTTITVKKSDHIRDRISLGSGDANNEYARNIQVADLNALNASLAVIKWKKIFGFYLDLDHEHSSTFAINGNALINEDQA